MHGFCHTLVPQASGPGLKLAILSLCMLCISQDYLKELDTPSTSIYKKSTLDRTFTVAYNNTRCHSCCRNLGNLMIFLFGKVDAVPTEAGYL